MSRQQPLFQAADSVEEKILSRIPIETLGLSLAASIAALLLFDPVTGLLTFLGGLFSALNFIWLKSTVSRALAGGSLKPVRALLPLYLFRILLIIGIFFIIIFFFSKKIFAFIAGFSMIIPVFLIESAGALSKLKQWKS